MSESLLENSTVTDTPPTGARSPEFLRVALGIVYLHFGFLKFFPDLSPAETIASQTIMILSMNLVDAHAALLLLGLFECAIGLGFLFGVARLWLPFIFLLHMVGTALPLFVLPEFAFKIAPFAPTLEGQYILKNLVFVAAGWTVLVPRLAFSKPSLKVCGAFSRVRLGPTARAKA